MENVFFWGEGGRGCMGSCSFNTFMWFYYGARNSSRQGDGCSFSEMPDHTQLVINGADWCSWTALDISSECAWFESRLEHRFHCFYQKPQTDAGIMSRLGHCCPIINSIKLTTLQLSPHSTLYILIHWQRCQIEHKYHSHRCRLFRLIQPFYCCF